MFDEGHEIKTKKDMMTICTTRTETIKINKQDELEILNAPVSPHMLNELIPNINIYKLTQNTRWSRHC